MKFTVPLVPPSVNHYVKHTRKGIHYVTGEGKAFKDAVAIFGGQEARRIFEAGGTLCFKSYEVRLSIYLGKRDKGDVDNFAKCCLDGLVEGGIIRSDADVDKLTVEKFRDWQKPRTEIEVTAILEV